MIPEGFGENQKAPPVGLGVPAFIHRLLGKTQCGSVWGIVMDKTDVIPALMGPLNWGWGRGKEYQIYRTVCDKCPEGKVQETVIAAQGAV